MTKYIKELAFVRGETSGNLLILFNIINLLICCVESRPSYRLKVLRQNSYCIILLFGQTIRLKCLAEFDLIVLNKISVKRIGFSL